MPSIYDEGAVAIEDHAAEGLPRIECDGRNRRDRLQHFGVDNVRGVFAHEQRPHLRATSSAEARMASWVVPPRWGVRITLFSSSRGLAVSGSLANTSSAAPAIVPSGRRHTEPLRPPLCRGRS